jgi:uncharacterized membrane protein
MKNKFKILKDQQIDILFSQKINLELIIWNHQNKEKLYEQREKDLTEENQNLTRKNKNLKNALISTSATVGILGGLLTLFLTIN